MLLYFFSSHVDVGALALPAPETTHRLSNDSITPCVVGLGCLLILPFLLMVLCVVTYCVVEGR